MVDYSLKMTTFAGDYLCRQYKEKVKSKKIKFK